MPIGSQIYRHKIERLIHCLSRSPNLNLIHLHFSFLQLLEIILYLLLLSLVWLYRFKKITQFQSRNSNQSLQIPQINRTIGSNQYRTGTPLSAFSLIFNIPSFSYCLSAVRLHAKRSFVFPQWQMIRPLKSET